jgi:hypothetical protein
MLPGPVAQPGERRPRMAEVTSSSLVGSTPFFIYLQVKTSEKGVESERTLLAALCSSAARNTGHHHGPLSSRLPSVGGSEALGSTGTNLDIGQLSA